MRTSKDIWLSVERLVTDADCSCESEGWVVTAAYVTSEGLPLLMTVRLTVPM